MQADDIIGTLGLQPHPEGGWYRQTWAGNERPRAFGTCIYFLLRAGERSHWHRVDAAEIWHYSISGLHFEGFDLAPEGFDIPGR
jgi:hypothetical protein